MATRDSACVVRLSKLERAALEAISRKSGRTLSSVVRDSIARELAREEEEPRPESANPPANGQPPVP